jgi:hypothetical protein
MQTFASMDSGESLPPPLLLIRRQMRRQKGNAVNIASEFGSCPQPAEPSVRKNLAEKFDLKEKTDRHFFQISRIQKLKSPADCKSC